MTDPAFTGHHPEPQSPGSRIHSGNNASILLLAANGRRRQARFQNVGTTAVFLALGSTASNTDGTYFWILAPCSGSQDGYGGGYVEDLWTGPISAFGADAFSVVVSEL